MLGPFNEEELCDIVSGIDALLKILIHSNYEICDTCERIHELCSTQAEFCDKARREFIIPFMKELGGVSKSDPEYSAQGARGQGEGLEYSNTESRYLAFDEHLGNGLHMVSLSNELVERISLNFKAVCEVVDKYLEETKHSPTVNAFDDSTVVATDNIAAILGIDNSEAIVVLRLFVAKAFE